MAREPFQSLTEQMYYILLALMEPRCGVDISQAAARLSRKQLSIGLGTLYTLLAKFEQEGMIRTVRTEGRKRYYQITDHGKEMLFAEYRRLKRLVEGGAPFLEHQTDREVYQ